MKYFFAFAVSMALVAALTPVVRRVAVRWHVLDVPGEPRKIHMKPTPLLGGVAVFLGLMAVMWLVAFATPYLLDTSIKLKHLIGLSLGGLVLLIGGWLDDKYNLKPSRQIVFSIIAVLIIIASGIGIRQITNPFGGTISLVSWERVLFWWQGVGYRITLPADLFTFVWLMALIYTTKFLDGLDGLVSGITAIGAFMIFFLATATRYFQPEVGVLSVIVAGAFIGFLFWNWHPAKIFLGTGGSTLAGFLLGALAIVSGGKIATALLVLGVPVLDAGWVIARRMFWEHRMPTLPDKKHLHFRLLDAGFSHRGAVVFLWSLSVAFGVSTLFLQSKQKLMVLGVLTGIVVILASWLIARYKHMRYES